MDTISLLLLVIALVVVYLAFYKKRGNFHLLPGPRGLPFIGNAWQIDQRYTYLDITELGKKYGDIFKLHMYGHDIVVVTGEDLLQKALVTESVAFAGRPRHVRIELLRENGFHVSFCDYDARLKSLKKLLLNCMKMYGDGLDRIEELVHDKTSELLERCQATKGKPFDFENEIFIFMMNIMMSLTCAGVMTREEIGRYVEADRKTLPLIGSGNLAMVLDFIPWSRYLPIEAMRIIREYVPNIKALVNPFIEERKKSFDGRNVECLIDAMLQFNSDARDNEKYTMRDIRAVVLEINGAGIATSSSILYYFLAQCIVKQDMQKRIQHDIDTCIGQRAPTLGDQDNMPFLQAAIFETLRITSNVPFCLPHKTTRDVELGGYQIPKDTQIWMNIWALHHDERYWDEPWSFKPERFLTSDGQFVPPDHINRKRFLAFGAGRRVCVGEAMAKKRLFLLIVTLFQRFTLQAESENKLPDIDPRHLKCGVVLHPLAYKMRMIPRL